jgi:hypothetical protein
MKLVVLLTFGVFLSLGATPEKTQAKVAAAGSVHAPQAPEIGEVQVDKWMRSWRKRLGLEDWEINTQMVRSSDLKPDTLGNLRWNSGSKTATIRVLAPMDYDLPAAEIPADIEYTVVHELVHLQLAALPREAASKNTEEQVVNRLSEALMALEKGPRYRPRASVAHFAVKDKDRSVSEASRATKQ